MKLDLQLSCPKCRQPNSLKEYYGQMRCEECKWVGPVKEVKGAETFIKINRLRRLTLARVGAMLIAWSAALAVVNQWGGQWPLVVLAGNIILPACMALYALGSYSLYQRAKRDLINNELYR